MAAAGAGWKEASQAGRAYLAAKAKGLEDQEKLATLKWSLANNEIFWQKNSIFTAFSEKGKGLSSCGLLPFFQYFGKKWQMCHFSFIY